MSLHIDASALREALVRLRGGMSESGLTKTLHAVCASAVELLAVQGAGLMVVGEDDVLRFIAASDGHARDLEHAQEVTGEGPCVDAMVEDVLVRTDDVVADRRWPKLAAELTDSPVRAVLGVPIHAGGSGIGSLNVYRSDAYTWDASDLEAIEAFAAVVEQLVGTAILAESREVVIEQLRYALDSRVMIDRAVGVLMNRDRIGATAAFQELRSTARAERRKVAEVARQLLLTLDPEPEPEPPSPALG